MTMWQYAQLTIAVDRHPMREDTRNILWHGPGQDAGKDYSESNQTMLELLNRFGADGWELAGIQDYREGGDEPSHLDASHILMVYTFKRPYAPAVVKSPEPIQKGKSPRSQQIRIDQLAHSEDDNLAKSKPVDSAMLLRFTVYRLRDSEPTGSATDSRDSELVAGRFLIERRIARPNSQADIDKIESFRVEYEDLAASKDRREEIDEAAADYAASWVQGQWADAWWETPQSFPLTQAADLFNDSAEWLRGLVEQPLADIESAAGAEGPIGSIGAGITANFVTARLTGPLEGAARLCEVAGIVIGVVTGAQPLVMACAKRLAHDELGNMLARGFKQMIDSIGADRERAAEAERDAAIVTHAADSSAVAHPVRSSSAGEASSAKPPAAGRSRRYSSSAGEASARDRRPYFDEYLDGVSQSDLDDYPGRGGDIGRDDRG